MLQHSVAPQEEQLKNKKTLALRQKNKHVVHYENPEKQVKKNLVIHFQSVI